MMVPVYFDNIARYCTGSRLRMKPKIIKNISNLLGIFSTFFFVGLGQFLHLSLCNLLDNSFRNFTSNSFGKSSGNAFGTYSAMT